MAKTRAYRTESGSDWVTAAQIRRIRDDHYDGQPTNEIFYSYHAPGMRKKVKHVKKGRSAFFAYVNGGGNADGSDGESLQHILFKEALSKLDRVQLSLRLAGTKRRFAARIRISSGNCEHPIIRAGEIPLRADVCVHFEGEDDLGKTLATKWSNLLYIEVRHTHAVDATKQDALRSLGVAVLEVPIPDFLRYDVPDDRTSDETEERYMQKVKRILEGEGGFLKGVVLSNPSSREYLEQRVRSLGEENRKLQLEVSALKDALSSKEEELQSLSTVHGQSKQLLADTQGTLQAMQRDRAEAAGRLAAAGNTVSRLRGHRRWLIAASVLLGLICALLLVAPLR